MNKSTSKNNDEFYKEENIFDHSSFFADLETSWHKNMPSGSFTNNLDNSALNVSALCCDEEINGYDKLTGRTWIYPTNYPVRQYQFNIIQATMIKNTLVSLPTGLGKTFIAAVIMYNFYRWYPLGKIIFTAPTRPLVAQQIDACYNIVAIPQNDTVEMTGNMQINIRKTQWQNKRVFFATPQVIYNDIQSGICPADKIRCIVFDEAHRARGNYAYCQIVSTLTDMRHQTYRILALSATPGSRVEDVVTVIRNLHIAHLELRTEDCIDVIPYSHSRKINTTVIPLGAELTQLRNQYVEILDGYARRLKDMNILPQNVGNLSKGRIVMLYKEYQNRDRGARHPQHNYIMKDFTLLISLYHGLELLVKHGSRVFLNFFDEHPEKSWIQSDDRLTAFLERLRDDLGVNPLSLNRSILPDGSVPEIPKTLHFGHPKFHKLKEIILDHFEKFKNKGQETKAIVFCEYRESVNLVHCLLLQCRPLIMPQMFVGQGAGKVSQKQQLRVMRNFREGGCNTLVATCVAEEGLDVGSVDLIICFDISTRSPIRLVQRCGRTGRERGGQVYILVTEGKEHQTLMDCMRQRDGLNQKIQKSKEVENNLYNSNPRMIPHDFMPRCQKMFITVAPKNDSNEKKSRKGQLDLRAMLVERNSSSSSSSSRKEIVVNNYINQEQFQQLFPDGFQVKNYFPEPQEYWAMQTVNSKLPSNEELNLTKWLEWQRTLQQTINVGHSADSEIFSELLQYIDAKRFELPVSTQNPTFSTQVLSTQNLCIPPPIKQKVAKKKQISTKPDGDIRALFNTATKSTKNYTKLINELGIHNDGNVPTTLLDLLVDLSVSNIKREETQCQFCRLVCDCTVLNNINKRNHKETNFEFLTKPHYPNIDLLDEINSESIKNYIEKRDLALTEINDSYETVTEIQNYSTNFDLDFEFIEANSQVIESTITKKSIKNFDIGDIEDIFAESLPDEDMFSEDIKIECNKLNTSNPKDTLDFFGLESIEDIFACTNESVNTTNTKVACDESAHLNNIKESNIAQPPLSPSILSGTYKQCAMPTSPILCSQARKLSMKRNRPQSSTPICKTLKPKRLLDTYTSIHLNESIKPLPNLQESNDNKSVDLTKSVDFNNTKSLLTITQIVNMINRTNGDSNIESNYNLNDRSTSPILLTQTERKLSYTSQTMTKNQMTKSLIVLDSDSDSDFENTILYDLDNKIEADENTSGNNLDIPSTSKRKERSDDDDFISCSPYFKRMKINESDKTHGVQDKLRAILNKRYDKNSQQSLQKENIHPQSDIQNNEPELCSLVPKSKLQNNIQKLQIFRRNIANRKKVGTSSYPLPEQSFVQDKTEPMRTLSNGSIEDSDDDFVSNKKDNVTNVTGKSQQFNAHRDIVKHKVRKKKKANEFLDLEAELTDNSEHSGDELSDDSVGSIVNFICDDKEQSSQEIDIQAHYLHSIKNREKGVFKIPELPSRLDNVCSQVVNEEDNYYEMDSFCVDSHIGLTQSNDVSELEVAEMLLEAKRKKRDRRKNKIEDFSVNTTKINGDSPITIKRKIKNKRQINSDTDDSS